MLISEGKSFVFIHVYKNAGTSIRSALLPFTVSKWKRRLTGLLNRVNLKIPAWDPSPYANHIKARELIEKIGEKKFNKYFSFAIVRNPWDWQVSLYKYMLQNKYHHQHELTKKMNSFDEYIGWRCKEEVRYQKDFLYSEDGKLLVDYVGRFEQLTEEFEKICKIIGVKTHLPKKNVSNNKPYQEYYNEETKRLVEETFKPDIDCWNYEF